MRCRVVNLGNGVTAFLCGGQRVPCSVPGCRASATRECDYPVIRAGVKGTCDAKLCDRCAIKGQLSVDYCPPHSRAPKPQLDLFAKPAG
jgi:hypothetical protein